jgi:AcrR family transcriptional regulator
MVLREVMKKRPRARPRGSPGVQLGEEGARTMVLQGAADVLAKLGARAASVEDILKAAGISRRTFYRFYESKDDVLVALYRLGTDELLESCRAALKKESDPLRQIQGCIDAHLRNARDFGRLMFVLGGEAQRQESPLHARRMEVHAELISWLAARADGAAARRNRTDPLLYRAILLALEGVTRMVLEEGDEGREITDASIERARRVMSRIATSALAGEGAGVTRLPTSR